MNKKSSNHHTLLKKIKRKKSAKENKNQNTVKMRKLTIRTQLQCKQQETRAEMIEKKQSKRGKEKCKQTSKKMQT